MFYFKIIILINYQIESSLQNIIKNIYLYTDNTFEDQYSESKSDGFEDYHIDISDDDDEKGYASTNEEATLQESVPSVEPKNGNAYLETINRNVEKVMQKLDIMHEQNLMAHRKKLKLEMERNDLLRDLLNTFKTNAPTSSSSIACGHNISKSSQTGICVNNIMLLYIIASE